MTQTTLIFGATGTSGKHALKAAVEAGDTVFAFVRTPSKIPEDLLSKITVIQGDYDDLAAVAAAVKSSQPDAIIITTCLSRGSPVRDMNAKSVPAIINELKVEDKIGSVRVIYLSGLFAAPDAEPLPVFMKWVLAPMLSFAMGLKAQIADNKKVTDYLEKVAKVDKTLQYSVVRMGMVKEGELVGKLTKSSSGDTITFADMGAFLVDLSHDLGASGGAITVGYAPK